MECHSENINVVWGQALHSVETCDESPIASTLENLKEWITPMISVNTDTRLVDKESIGKKHLNVVADFSSIS